MVDRFGVKHVKGILLYGPPGTGKTYIVKALATETDCDLFIVAPSDILNKYVGQSERFISCLFDMVSIEVCNTTKFFCVIDRVII